MGFAASQKMDLGDLGQPPFVFSSDRNGNQLATHSRNLRTKILPFSRAQVFARCGRSSSFQPQVLLQDDNAFRGAFKRFPARRLAGVQIWARPLVPATLFWRGLEGGGCGSKLNHHGTTIFSLCVHLPGFHFGYLFLTHSQVPIASNLKTWIPGLRMDSTNVSAESTGRRQTPCDLRGCSVLEAQSLNGYTAEKWTRRGEDWAELEAVIDVIEVGCFFLEASLFLAA